MNKVFLTGRIAHQFELKGNENTKVVQIVVAIKGRNKIVDYIPVTVFNHSAEYLFNYASKGDLISVEGRIQNTVFEKEDTKFNTIQVVASSVDILTKKHESEKDEIEVSKEEDNGGVIYDADNLPF